MAITSRIPHPPGDRYVQLHHWVVKKVGRDAAAVLAEIEFRDRIKSQPGQPVATRADLIAALQGIVGRDSVDRALKLLQGLGWITRTSHTCLSSSQRNLSTTYEFALNAPAIASFLNSGKPEVPATELLSGREAENPHIRENQKAPPSACGGGIDNLDDLIVAALWDAQSAKTVKHPGAFCAAVRRRITETGPTPEDLDTLARWRRWQDSRASAPALSAETEPGRRKPPAGWRDSLVASLATPPSQYLNGATN